MDMEFFSPCHVQENTDSLGREKEREGQKGKIQLWANSVFDLEWPQNTNTAVTTQTPNSHAIAYALDAVFQIKIIGYGDT